MTTHNFQKVFLAGCVLAIALVLLGWVVAPQERVGGVLAAALILVVYGAVVWSLPGKLETITPPFLPTTYLFGLIAGLIFAGEIILEYIILPKDNSLMGLVESGSVFFMINMAFL